MTSSPNPRPNSVFPLQPQATSTDSTLTFAKDRQSCTITGFHRSWSPEEVQSFCNAQRINCILDVSGLGDLVGCKYVKESDWKCSDIEDNALWGMHRKGFFDNMKNSCDVATKNYCETVVVNGKYACRARLPFLAPSCDPPTGKTDDLQQESCSSQGPNCIFKTHWWTDDSECEHVNQMDFDCSRIEHNELWSSASFDTRKLLCETRTHGYCNLQGNADVAARADDVAEAVAEMSVNCRRADDWLATAAEW